MDAILDATDYPAITIQDIMACERDEETIYVKRNIPRQDVVFTDISLSFGLVTNLPGGRSIPISC